MAEYLLESYVSRGDRVAADAGAKRARRAAELLSSEGTPVRFLRTIFVPEDETCFYLYEAASIDAVREAARLAGLRLDRITEAVGEIEGGTGCRTATGAARPDSMQAQL